MGQSLSTLYRPHTFEEVCSQESIITILKKQLELQQPKNCYLFCGPSGCGKAQPYSAKVYTPTGYTTMQNINPGDYVLSGTGKSTVVENVFEQGQRDIYTIYLNDDTCFDVADNHLNYVFTQKHNLVKEPKVYETLTTLDLINKFAQSSDLIQVDLPVITDWSNHDIIIDPYLIGCLLGDGCLAGNLAFASLDSDIIDNVNRALSKFDYSLKKGSNIQRPSEYHIRPNNINTIKYKYIYKNKEYTTRELLTFLQNQNIPIKSYDTIYAIAGLSKKSSGKTFLKKYPVLSDIKVIVQKNDQTSLFRELLDNLGLLTTSDLKEIPKNYLYSDYNTRIALLQGLMDTDGSGSGGKLEFTTTSEKLAANVAELIRSLGGYCKVTTKQPKYFNSKYNEYRLGKLAYRLYIHVPSNIIPFRCQRKLDMYNSHPHKEPKRYIKNIIYKGIDFCKCIYVQDPAHTYITDNITITHNTTLARIFANELNNNIGLPIEIDGASNNGIDNIRQIIDSAANRAVDGKYKIYIMDEAQCLTKDAWSALLKLIEEPPEYTIFIFCTTDPQKIPPTILNRMMRFNFTRIPTDIIKQRLESICNNEKFINYTEACDYISRICSGQLRDAISMLDKCASYNTDLNITNILAALGDFTYDSMFKLINGIVDGNEADVLNIINKLYNDGSDLKRFIDQFLTFCLDLNKYVLFQSIQMTSIPSTLENELKYSTGFANAAQYFIYIINKLLDCKNTIKNDQNAKSTIEAYFLNMCRCQ